MLAAAGLSAAEETYLPGCSTTLPFFCVDAAYFRRGGRDRVEVYFSVTNRALQFVKAKRGGYEASADLSVILMEGGSSQVGGDTQRLRLRANRYEETTSADSVRTGVMSFPAHAGEYKLVIALVDRDTNMRSSVEARYDIPETKALPSLSDIRFEEPGTRGRSRVYPNVRRTYTGDLEIIPFYFEVYAEEMHVPLAVEYRVVGTDDVIAYRDTVLVSEFGEAKLEADIPADSISNGSFNLVLGFFDEKGEFEPKRAKAFEVRSQFFYWGKDVESAIDILTYVASGGFIEAFRKADAETRKTLWDDFWREKDPTPETPKNEFYEEHVRRFEFANERFRTSYTPGWKTDRGRIYIIYGPPDQVESYPYDMDRDPTEVWHYNRLSRRFVFVDKTGFGDYRLVDEY
jgi:GWxTD domain-containing protein